MKGAILGVAATAQIVDITHEIPPGDVEGAAFALAAAHAAFPPGTVFVAVVDPGVGSERRGLAWRPGRICSSAPTTASSRSSSTATRMPASTRSRTRPSGGRRWRPPSTAATCSAPWPPISARACPLDTCGPRVADPVRLPFPARPPGRLVPMGRRDRARRPLRQPDLLHHRGGAGGAWSARTATSWSGSAGAVAPLVRTYADVAPGEPCALVGSSGLLEFALRDGSAAEVLGAARGDVLRVRRVDQPPDLPLHLYVTPAQRGAGRPAGARIPGPECTRSSSQEPSGPPSAASAEACPA